MTGQHHPQQDADYVSKVEPARVAAFLQRFGTPPVANREAYTAAGAYPKPRVPGAISIAQDMPLAPKTYGFADRNAVNQWLEQAFDTPA